MGVENRAEIAEHELTHRQILTVFSGLLLGVFLASLDTTVVTTALPTIAGDLGGLTQLPWVLTAYLLTSTAATPLYGKLSDLYGRRRLYLIALGIFLVSSLLAGLSQNMLQLIIFRGLQGAGGGGLGAMGFIILGELVSPRARGRYIGYFTAAFTSSALLGPVIGGYFVDHASWRWVFYVNIPLGLVALAVVDRVLRLPFPTRDHRIDWLGAGLLVTGVTLLILAMVWGGDAYAWSSPVMIGSFIAVALLAGAFVAQERRAPEPILPLHLFGIRTFALAMVISLAAGAAMMSANAFLPLFLQVVTGTSATSSGLLLAPMMISMTITAAIAGNLTTRTGRYKWLLVVGPLASTGALWGLSGVGVSTTSGQVTMWMILMGVGIGMLFPTITTATQNALALSDLGAGTAAITFFRSLGQTIGIGAYGAVLAGFVHSELPDLLPPGSTDLDVDRLLNTPARIKLLDPGVRDAVVRTVADGTARIFALATLAAVVTIVTGLMMREEPLRDFSALAADEASNAGGPEGHHHDSPGHDGRGQGPAGSQTLAE